MASFMRNRSRRLLARTAPQIARALHDVWVKPGEAFFRVGDPSTTVYFLASGEVELRRHDARNVFGVGSVIGTSDVLRERARTQDAVALKESHALALSSLTWLEILEDNPEIAMRAIHGIATMIDARHPSHAAPPAEQAALVLASKELALVDRLLSLKRVPAFQRARIQTLASIAAATDVVVLGAGERIATLATRATIHHTIVSGLVESTRTHTGDAVQVETFGAGELLHGVASFVHGATFDTVAKTEAVLMRVTQEELFDVIEDHIDLARSILTWLEEERDRTETRT